VKRPAAALLLVGLAAAALAAWLFPRALPILALSERVDRDAALQRANTFIAAHDLAPDSARRAVAFISDDSLRTFVELAGGGKDSLEALLRGREVALYSWLVRAFTPGDARETRIRLSPDGRVIGVRRTLPDSLVRPSVDEAAGRLMADSVLTQWLGEPTSQWSLATSSYATRMPSDRIDRTYTYERTGRTISGAPLRLDVVIAGDLVAEARPYVVIPESFGRRYGEMRSANDLLGLFSTIGLLGLIVLAMVALRRYAREHTVRWRAPSVIGVVVGAFVTAAMLNELPASWMSYDTAGSAELHRLTGVMFALVAGGMTVLLLSLTLAAAESLTRHAFPWHLDWWQYWKNRGTRAIASRVGGGYVVAALGFAYVAAFYAVTRGAFGWWVPSEMIDDPNRIASPLPWVAGIGLSLQAAISEEALFRAVPLSIIALWAAPRADKDRWMAAGVVVTALLFGFAHSTYPSWPPYSRGVEIFLEACVWGVLFLRFGILVPVVAHFVYDLVLFGLFATAGSGVEYRTTAAIMLLALVAPALAVTWARLRQGRWLPLGEGAYFGAWAPAPVHVPPIVPASPRASTVPIVAGARLRLVALGIPVVAVVATLVKPPAPTAGPEFSVSRNRIGAVADSMLQSRGVDPVGWRRLIGTSTDTALYWRRFLAKHDAESLATVLAPSYAIPAWWVARYVRTDTSLAERAEEWRIRIYPDGRPLDTRHILPEAAPGASLARDSVRSLAVTALRAAGFAPGALSEVKYEEARKPARRDATVTYVDTTVALPAAATARAWASIAGDEVLVVRRGVELPEAFVRETRGEEQSELVVVTVVGMAALALIIWAVIRARRRPVVATDHLSRRALVIAFSVIAVSSVVGSLLGLPAELTRYDTAMPWRTFMTSVWATQLMSLLGVFFLAAFWLLLNGLRQRAGVPLVAASRRGRWTDDTVVAMALGGLPLVTGLAGHWLTSSDIPGPPHTLLDRFLPALAPMTGVIPGAIAIVLAVAIPALAVRGFSPRPEMRVLLAVGLMALIGAAALSTGTIIGGDSAPWQSAAWAIVSTAIALLALVVWGSVSVLSWFMAALFLGALSGINDVITAPTTVERYGAALAVTLALGLFAAGARYAQQRAEPAGSWQRTLLREGH
jgi:membrane protease YdiL (CAAX protease family)